MTALLTTNLPLLLSAPDGIVKLRVLIRDLAVKGRLVPQDWQAESAHEALERVAASRQKGALLPSSSAVEEPHPVPSSWVWTTFGKICRIKGDLVRPEDYLDCAQVAPDCIEKGTGRLLERRTVRQSGIRGPNNKFIAGQILYSKIRPSLSKAVLVDFDGLCSADMYPIESLIFPRYQLLVMLSETFLAQVRIAENRVKMPKLNQESLNAFAFPVPPLEEQHRIVAKVDELMALCDRLEAEQADAEAAHAKLVEALLASLTQARDAADFRASWQQLAEHFHTLFTTEASVDALKQTVLQLAVTGRLLPLETTFLDGSGESIGSTPLPSHWDVVPFNDLVDQNFPIAYGVLVPGPEAADGVPFVRIADLSLNATPQLPEKRISREVDAKFSRTRLVGGEILMGVVGSIGKLGIAPPSWAGANIARAICRIVPAPTVSREFVLWLLQSDLMRSQFIGDTRTLAQPTLNVGLIRAARTPLPPLEEQRRIVAKVEELLGCCDVLKSELAAARECHGQVAAVLVEHAEAGM